MSSTIIPAAERSRSIAALRGAIAWHLHHISVLAAGLAGLYAEHPAERGAITLSSDIQLGLNVDLGSLVEIAKDRLPGTQFMTMDEATVHAWPKRQGGRHPWTLTAPKGGIAVRSKTLTVATVTQSRPRSGATARCWP